MDNLNFQIYDDRKGGFDRTSVCCFIGRYGAKVRFSKGDIHLGLVAKGYEGRTVRLEFSQRQGVLLSYL